MFQLVNRSKRIIPSYHKYQLYLHLQALDRRGQARLELKKYTEALADFEEAKKIEPKTVSVEKNISAAKAGMAEAAGGVDKAGAKKAMAEANAEFKKGNYEGALEHYSKVNGANSEQQKKALISLAFAGHEARP